MKRVLTLTSMALFLLLPLGSSAADAGAGKEKAAPCTPCHNADNLPLTGKEAGALETAMKAIRDGDIAHPPALTNMSDEDLADIAAYLSSS